MSAALSSAGQPAPATPDAWLAANPFPGLRSFKPAEGDRFFGRGQQIDELVQRLAASDFVAVSGASGCGKSSLVLAGLLSTLARRHAEGGDTEWRTVVLRPGNRPIAHLAAPLARALQPGDPNAPGAAEEIAERAEALNGRLRLGGLALTEAVRQAKLGPDVRVLVIVDQFEEIFRFKRVTDADEAAAFVKLLLQAGADPGSPVSVIITLRSDTLGECAAFRDLPEAVSRGGYLVPRLKRDQRKEAIVKPVELRGARIAPRLVQRLLNDVSDDFDDLPVMQHVLSRTWRQWARSAGGGRPIDLEDYDAVGGAAKALDRHADEAAADLAGAAGQGATPTVARVFRALTERVAEGTEIRRPLPFDELVAVCGGTDAEGHGDAPDAAALRAEVTRTVERYRRADTAFLLPGAEVPLADNPVIDISHESLIRLWTRLRGWVNDESEARAELVRLLDDADAHAQGHGELWRGRSLDRARDWEAAHRPNGAWVALVAGAAPGPDGPRSGARRWADAQAFLAASKDAERRERRGQRLQVWTLRGLSLGVVVVSVAAAFSGHALKQQAGSRELASRSMTELVQDPARAARLGRAAVELDADSARAQYALRQAMSDLDVARVEAIAELESPVVDARLSADGQQLVVAAGAEVQLRDPATLALKSTVPAASEVASAWLVGDRLLVRLRSGQVQLLAADGKPVSDLSCTGTGNWADTAALSTARDGQPAQLAVGCADGELMLWNLAGTGATSRTLLPAARDKTVTSALAFSSDGQWLAAGDTAGDVRLWKRGEPEQPFIGGLPPKPSPIHHQAAVRDISFHPTEPTLLGTASDDSLARVWSVDLITGFLVPDSPKDRTQFKLVHDHVVQRARWVRRADETDYRLMTMADKRVFFWSDETTKDERLHDDWVTDANTSADGEMLVTASADGTARVWSSRSSVPIAVLRGHRNELTRAFFAADAGTVYTASRDRTLRRWRIAPPRLLAVERAWLMGAAFAPDGKNAALCGTPFLVGDNQRVNCEWVPLAGVGAVAQAASAASATAAAGAGASPAAAGGRRPLDAQLVSAVQRLSISRDGRWLAGERLDLDFYGLTWPVLWRLDTGRQVAVTWANALARAVFIPGRDELLTVERSGASLAVWAAKDIGDNQAKPQWALDIRPSYARRQVDTVLAGSPDGRWIAIARGAQVLLYDRQAPQSPPRLLAGHGGDVRQLVFSADSGRLASASADRTARVWTVSGLKAPAGAGAAASGSGMAPVAAAVPVLELVGHSAGLRSVAFDPQGRRVVTGSADNTVRVWDAANGAPLASLTRHAGAVNAVAVAPDGQGILSVSDDGSAVLSACAACDAPLDDLQRRADGVRMPAGERLRIDSETRLKFRLFMLPRWLAREE